MGILLNDGRVRWVGAGDTAVRAWRRHPPHGHALHPARVGAQYQTRTSRICNDVFMNTLGGGSEAVDCSPVELLDNVIVVQATDAIAR